MTELRSALIVAVPGIAPVLHPWLEQTASAKPSRGIPAHVTILFPFVPADALDDPLVEQLTASFAAFPTFSFALRRTRRFPEVLYLAPEPAEFFLSLTEAVVASYPDYPPYGGEFDEVVPHVTVAEGDAQTLDAAEADVVRALPFTAEVREILLLEETEPDMARWQICAFIPLCRP